MLRRFNYTHRATIRKSDVSIRVREIAGAPPVATVAAQLDDYGLPSESEVFVEAYRKATYARSRLGTIGEFPDSFEFALHDFDTPDAVQFRLKVVGRSDLSRDAPLLLAVADGLSAVDGDDEDHDLEKLLSMMPADLNGEVWRVDLTERPILLIEREYWDDRQFVRSGWFFPLVVPTMLREAIRGAMSDGFRALDEESWQSRWLNFALSIPGDPHLPDRDAAGDEIEEWINARVEAFCRSQKIRDRIAPVMRGQD